MARESAAGPWLRLALASGWQAEEIFYTGTNLSSHDLDRILAVPLVLNLDSLSAIRRLRRAKDPVSRYIEDAITVAKTDDLPPPSRPQSSPASAAWPSTTPAPKASAAVV